MSGYPELIALGEEEALLKESVHRFAAEVIRPAARALDRMAPEERIAPDSPYFDVVGKFRELGYQQLIGLMPAEPGGEGTSGETGSAAQLEAPSALGQSILLEELGWGSMGLATALAVGALPFALVHRFGTASLNDRIIDEWLAASPSKSATAEAHHPPLHGCWGATEPDHGSDGIAWLREREMNHPGRQQVVAEQDGDAWIVNGQKSAWVSSAPTATHCALHVQVSGGSKFEDGMLLFVPLDLPGVRRGPPIAMLGARDDPQGALYFDSVRVPGDHVIVPAGPFYPVFVDQLLCNTSASVANIAVGVARAAFEEALAYARTRVQGGTTIVHHKNIQLTLYSMFEKIETARAYARKVMAHVYEKAGTGLPFALSRHTRVAQIYAKRIAFEVAHDAVQICGAYGLSDESLVEKLFRDARSMLIEDGTLEVLSLDAANDLVDNYEKENYDPQGVMTP
jgi:alkylation response protein AidB-like acyl-CoA dehydrogenase